MMDEEFEEMQDINIKGMKQANDVKDSKLALMFCQNVILIEILRELKELNAKS